MQNGDSPLHIAAAMGRRKLVKILLESPLLEAELTNQQNETALNIAERKNHQEIATMIRHPPPVIKNNPENNENISTETKAEINVTIDSEESKHHFNKKAFKKVKKSALKQQNYPPGQEPKWSPYGCHYYPDMAEFPEPQMDTLPHEPLKAGEQYFLDLAGNIKKGPSGHGSTCYCAPFIHRYLTKFFIKTSSKFFVK